MAIFRGTGGQGDSTTDTTVTTVTQKAAEAASSATSAATSATSAANSASSASTSETNAATSETNAATSATASATSATASETAKTASEAAQTAAETAEANAETAEANAVTAKNQAVSAKDNAVVAQTAAETAETNAETAYADTLAIFGDAQDVQDAVDSASASATTATTKAAEAASSATDAFNYSSSAGTSATQAASSASQAATSAASANSYATDAQTAQTAAETAQAAAEASEAEIKGLYLGSLADDPTLDGNGVAVTTGDLYFNTTAQEVRVYTDGDVWEPVVDLAGDITVNSLTSNNDVVVKGNLEVQGTTITVDSATAQTIDLGDNDKIRFGDGDDFQIYHDGTDSYIANTTGTLKLSSNTDVTGNITVSGTVDGRDIAADGTTLDAVASTYVDVSGDTLTGDLAFGDNVKATFGASDDLQIYHDGSHSYIKEVGTGNLRFDADNWYVRSADGSEAKIAAITNGAVSLYYDGTVKLATTSSGVDITGTVVADGLTVEGTDTTTSIDSTGRLLTFFGASNNHIIRSDATDSNLQLRANDFVSINKAGTTTPYFKVDNQSGDISFYEDTGTSQNFYWDASTSRLGLGTTSPSALLDIYNTNASSPAARFYGNFQTIQNLRGFQIYNNQSNGQVDTTLVYGNTANSYLAFGHHDGTSYAERMRIDSSGRLGIGTTNPQATLQVSSGSDYVRCFDSSSRGIQINQADPILSLRDSDATGTPLCDISGSGGILSLRADASNETASSAIQFTVDGSEAARIDSSGNLLVGTTDNIAHVGSSSGEGISLSAGSYGGFIGASRSNAVVTVLNRQTSDGAIAEFRKDGSTVGSIGSRFGVALEFVMDSRSGAFQGAGISGSGEAITPMDHSQQADDHTSLGNSAYRWKNLYLSGGVYLGGTTSDNLLDDYEEGTFTVTLTGGDGGSIPLDDNTAYYTKIGDMVYVTGQVRILTSKTVTATGSYINIQGLPYTSYNDSTLRSSGALSLQHDSTSWGAQAGGMRHNDTKWVIEYDPDLISRSCSIFQLRMQLNYKAS